MANCTLIRWSAPKSTPLGFMLPVSDRHSGNLEAALTLAQDAAWLRHAAANSGLLHA